MAWYNDAWNAVKKGASDIGAVAAQVGSMTLGVGKAALDGAGTLLTDPGKFAKDVANNLGEAGRHISGGFKDGMDMIGEGWNEAVEAGNPGMFLWKALGGTAQMASMGTIHAFKEHVADVSAVQRDELGNMTGFAVSEDADAITRIFLERGGGTMSTIANADTEVKEALAEGDRDKANKMFGHMVGETVVKPVGKAAMIAGTAVLVTGTGGAAAPFIAAGLGAGGILASGQGSKSGAAFDIANVDDDIADRVDADIAALQAAGRLQSEADVAKYRETMSAYYGGAAYTGEGDGLGEAYMGEGATNQDFKAWMLEAAELPSVPEAGTLQAATAEHDAEQPAVAGAAAEAAAKAVSQAAAQAAGAFRGGAPGAQDPEPEASPC